MQIKIIFIAFLIASSYLIGEYIYKIYVNRYKQINEMIRVFEMIRADISFGMYTLEEIFRSIGKKSFCCSNFFLKLADDLESEEYKTLDMMILENSQSLSVDTYLVKSEIDEIVKLILTIGKSDVESQQRFVDLSIENFKKLTSQIKEDITKKGSLYKKLVTFVGIGISIIIL